MNNCDDFWFWFMRPFAETLGISVIAIGTALIIWIVFSIVQALEKKDPK